MKIILGSTSPRRKEILGYFDLPFEQVKPDFDEDAVPFTGDPLSYVKFLSNGKAKSLVKDYSDHIIITADTIVYCNNKLYGKAATHDDSFNALSELAGKWNSVFTGLTLVKGDKFLYGVEETRVLLNKLTPEQIRSYQAKIHLADKAGYAAQGPAGVIIERIEGAYDNVLGFPVNTLHCLLLQVGIDLWDHLKSL
jgi:septum formation protein